MRERTSDWMRTFGPLTDQGEFFMPRPGASGHRAKSGQNWKPALTIVRAYLFRELVNVLKNPSQLGNCNFIPRTHHRVYADGWLKAFAVRSPSNLCQGCFSFCSTSVTILRILSSTGGVASSYTSPCNSFRTSRR